MERRRPPARWPPWPVPNGAVQSPFRQEHVKYARVLYENRNHEMSRRDAVSLREVGDRLWKEGYQLLSPGQLARFVFTGSRAREEPLTEMTPYAWYTVVRLWTHGWRIQAIMEDLRPAFHEPAPGTSGRPRQLDEAVPDRPTLTQHVMDFLGEIMLKRIRITRQDIAAGPAHFYHLREELIKEFCCETWLDEMRTQSDQYPGPLALWKGADY